MSDGTPRNRIVLEEPEEAEVDIPPVDDGIEALSAAEPSPEPRHAERGAYYATTPIFYVNAAPHLGHAYTTLLVDVVTRFHRLKGDDTFFLTGTDEHGLKVQRAAEANGVTPLEWADRTSERFRDAWTLLDISNDDFIRTSEPRHHESVQQILQRVYDNGHIELGTYEGLYCVACEAYYTVDDLIDGERCPIHDRPVEQVKEDNYFFKLSSFQQQLLDWYAANPGFVRPATKRNEALGFIKGGLDDFSISRSSMETPALPTRSNWPAS